jgi:hypothetical protein
MEKIRRDTKSMTIEFEPSKISNIKNPEYLLNMDKLIMSNGDTWLVSNASKNKIELQLLSRKTISQENLPEFLKDLNHIQRADCFEIN